MQGILLIDKPQGWTSFDVVNYVRRMVASVEGVKPKTVKVGHTGTLDPLATGLLVVLVGKEYTRKAQELSAHDKSYAVTLKLGHTSSTGDDEGDKTFVSDIVPSKDQVLASLGLFTGEIMQTPPIFSAIKVDGKRAYDLARAGKEVTLEPRKVTVHAISNVTYKYPYILFDCHVSSGTYIRSLAQDIGENLKTGAYMSALRRTSVGAFHVSDAITPEDIQKTAIPFRP